MEEADLVQENSTEQSKRPPSKPIAARENQTAHAHLAQRPVQALIGSYLLLELGYCAVQILGFGAFNPSGHRYG